MSAPIPVYPAARPPEIFDRELLRDCLRNMQPVISELCFANLFLFRHAHQYALSSINDSLLVFGHDYSGLPYVLPPLSGDRGEAARFLLDAGNTLYGVDGQFLAQHLTGRGYAVVEDRDNDDYLYRRTDLAELPGVPFHKKRNRIHYFTSRHTFTVEPFSRRHLAAALHLLDRWQRRHEPGGSPSQQAETAAAREGLERADELGLSGVVILTAKGVAAFALGEQLNDLTVACLFEKSDPDLEGAAQLINREFSRFQQPGCTYINREQDLGNQGLKEAKSSYHPVEMIRKFRVMARTM